MGRRRADHRGCALRPAAGDETAGPDADPGHPAPSTAPPRPHLHRPRPRTTHPRPAPLRERAAPPPAPRLLGAAHPRLHGLLRPPGRRPDDRLSRRPARVGCEAGSEGHRAACRNDLRTGRRLVRSTERRERGLNDRRPDPRAFQRPARGGGMTEKHYDIVIIGSGAGGGTVVQALAPMVRDGVRILVLEQGPRLRDDEFTGSELDMSGALYEDNGGFLTAEGTMTLAFGRSYGGSTVVYTGTSIIAPERVIRRWGVPGLEHEDIATRSRKFMEENNVHLQPPERINENNRLFVEGCEKAGYRAEQFPINVKGCRGSSLCNLGCPNAAKQGTNRVQLPNAEKQGVEVVTRAEALRIEERAVIIRIN